MNRTIDVATSMIATGIRLGAGRVARVKSRRPEKLLELYEFEACPFCRKTREALTALDLDALIYPCPRGSRYRDTVIAKGGKRQFPFLVDPNTGVQMYESLEIARYLADTYAGGSPGITFGPLSTLSSTLASAIRFRKGGMARPGKTPSEPLDLWSYESSPYCRIVRETLCDLQIPYRLHNVGKNSQNRHDFALRAGKTQFPYLSDPNTGTAMFESDAIVKYLEATYAEEIN